MLRCGSVGRGGRGSGRRPGPLLDDGLPLCGDDLLGAPVQLGVLDEAVAVREPRAALLAAVGLLALREEEERPSGKKELVTRGGHFSVSRISREPRRQRARDMKMRNSLPFPPLNRRYPPFLPTSSISLERLLMGNIFQSVAFPHSIFETSDSRYLSDKRSVFFEIFFI